VLLKSVGMVCSDLIIYLYSTAYRLTKQANK